MSENEETDEILAHSDSAEGVEDFANKTASVSKDSDMDSTNEDSRLGSTVPGTADVLPVESSRAILDADHPLMIKYQQDLKERLLKLLQESDEQLIDLNRTIKAQEKENDHFANQGYEFQKKLLQQEEKLSKICSKYEEQVENNRTLQEESKTMKQNFHEVESKWKEEIRKDLEYQKKLEDTAFQVVQLTSLQTETFTDAKSLQRAVEKTTKDRENLELQKLRQESIFL